MARLIRTLAIVLVVGMLLSGSALAGPGGNSNSGEPDIPNIVAPATHSNAVTPEGGEGRDVSVDRAPAAVEMRDARLLKRVLWSFLLRLHSFVAR
jgi:hypothetical protein